MNKKFQLTICLILFLQCQLAFAFTSNYWTKSHAKAETHNVSLKLRNAHSIQLNLAAFQQALSQQEIVIDVPLPNGKLVSFRLKENQTMAAELADKFPAIKSYSGHQIGQAENFGRFDFTPHGFHGMFIFNQQMVFVEPQAVGNNQHYISYYRQQEESAAFSDTVLSVKRPIAASKRLAKTELDNKLIGIKTFRFAVSATGEYTQYHGGTVVSGLAAVVTMVNRLNQVFNRELSIELQLVADNDQLIFTDASTDPFSNDDDDGEVNTDVINDAIGVNSYDLGHVVNTGAGGLAILGALCRDLYKGDGVTGRSNPTGDGFWIDYVAHEIGHQLGANHSFNGTTGSCDSGRHASAAYEPGGGSTIMAYAGICGAQNVSNSGIEYFHSHSLDEMNQTIAARSCGELATPSNHIPTADAGNDYTIPAHTPFALTGSATDTDMDNLSFEWQQFDLGSASNTRSDDQTDFGDGPLFRVFGPSESPIRTFPQLANILAGNLTYGETYPATNRALNFRFIVRDNQGGVNYDQSEITVVDTGEAFSVTSPVTGDVWQQAEQTILWQVADTNSAPISCQSVDIYLSSDSGQNFDLLLAEQVVNNGEHQLKLPNLTTNMARLKIQCSDNVFFNINDGLFSVDVETLAITDQRMLSIDEDTNITLTTDMFTYQGGSADSLIIASGENYTVAGNTITPAANFFGVLNVGVTAQSAAPSNVESDLFTATIQVTSVNDLPVALDDQLTVEQDSAATEINVLNNDTDIESNQLTLTSVNYVGNSSVTIVNNQIYYQPATGFSGTEIVSYIVSDSDAGSASGQLSITVNAANTGGNNSGNNSGNNNAGGNSSNNKSSSGGSTSVIALMMLLVAMVNKIGLFTRLKKVTKGLNARVGVVIFSGLVLASCSEVEQPPLAKSDQTNTGNINAEPKTTDELDVLKAIANAKAAKDYRVYVTSGRRMIAPGIALENQQQVIDQCGVKYFPNTSDVVNDEYEKQSRKQRVEFIEQYNQEIVGYCRQ